MKTGKYLLQSICLVILTAIFATPQMVHAALGESDESVELDRKELQADRVGTEKVNDYTVHEIGSDVVVVREYVSRSGLVFALVWRGIVQPDLTHLLGSYAAEYREATLHMAPQKGRRHLLVKTPGITVEKWGHMRDMHGRAYAPALIPAGVSVDEIR
jgi:hypothetical protein